jgi:hypothetical protein
MPDQADTEWLREPPGPTQVYLHVQAGQDISPDQLREALNKVLQVREEAKERPAPEEAQDFAGVTCNPLWTTSCAWYTGCRISVP